MIVTLQSSGSIPSRWILDQKTQRPYIDQTGQQTQVIAFIGRPRHVVVIHINQNEDKHNNGYHDEHSSDYFHYKGLR